VATTITSCAVSAGARSEVDGPAVERWADRIASDHGFVEIEHTLEIFGTCQDCSAKRG